MALEGLFRKIGATTVRRMVALGVHRGVEEDPAMNAQWFEHLRAAATATEPPHDGVDEGQDHGSSWTVQVGSHQNVPAKCRTTSAGSASSGTSVNGATPT